MNTKISQKSIDELLRLVSHRHRRRILTYLGNEPDQTATVTELLDDLHTTTDLPPGESTHRPGNVATQLQHVHLPELEESGLIECDSRSETVRYYPNCSVEHLLIAARTLCE